MPCELRLACHPAAEEKLVRWLTTDCPQFKLRTRRDLTTAWQWVVWQRHAPGCPRFVDWTQKEGLYEEAEQ